ncbi:MAG: thioesterase family protein [Bacteroidetes bacterium]|nr:thioesterase family protein [Bacteroidota bacterium]
MSTYSKPISFRWSDLDPNLHVRHSVYYDLGTQHRVEILDDAGLTMVAMHKMGFSPILFREECVFRREMRFGDEVTLETKILKLKRDASRWSIQHRFLLGEMLCATITIDGSWIDMKTRKLASPPPQAAIDVMNAFPKSEGFVWEE